MFTKLEAFLKGKKTYIVAGLLVIVSILDVITGDVTVVELVSDPNVVILLNGLGLATLRAGVQSSVK